nr:hypothetical protein [Tanacetum cinerariifolium]GEZ25154.1 hypothetical protein [Tanacetum cinerariifolium]
MMDKFTVEDKVEMLEPFDLSVYVVMKQLAERQLYCDAYCVKAKMQLGRQSTKFCCMLIDKQGNIGFPEHYFFVAYKRTWVNSRIQNHSPHRSAIGNKELD